MNTVNPIHIIPMLLSCLLVWFVAAKCCIYTALAVFLVLSLTGGCPLLCVGEVDGTDHYHAWVQYDGINIEQSTFNLYHSQSIEYNNPSFTYDNAHDFIESVDMSSPIR